MSDKKILEMPKSQTQINQLWSGQTDVKRNQAEFDDLFMGFQNQIDKLVAAKDMNRITEVPDKEEK